MQRQPRQQLGIGVRDDRVQPVEHDVVRDRPTPGRAARAAVPATPRTAWTRCRPRRWRAAGSSLPTRPRTSSSNRVLPMPGSPTISHEAARRPARVRVERARRARPSRRPARTSGNRSSGASRDRDPVASPSDHAWTGVALPFTANGSSSVDLEARVRVLQHVGGGVDLARARLGHEPGGQVHAVAHHRVRAPVPRADVAGEHASAVHADAERAAADRRRRSAGGRAACAPRRCRC